MAFILEEVFKKSLGLPFQSLLIKTPYAINHKKNHFVPPSVNNSLSVENFGIFVAKFYPFFLLTLEPHHFLQSQHRIILLLKPLLQLDHARRIQVVKLLVNPFDTHFQFPLAPEFIPKNVLIKFNGFIFHCSQIMKDRTWTI